MDIKDVPAFLIELIQFFLNEFTGVSLKKMEKATKRYYL